MHWIVERVGFHLHVLVNKSFSKICFCCQCKYYMAFSYGCLYVSYVLKVAYTFSSSSSRQREKAQKKSIHTHIEYGLVDLRSKRVTFVFRIREISFASFSFLLRLFDFTTLNVQKLLFEEQRLKVHYSLCTNNAYCTH